MQQAQFQSFQKHRQAQSMSKCPCNPYPLSDGPALGSGWSAAGDLFSAAPPRGISTSASVEGPAIGTSPLALRS